MHLVEKLLASRGYRVVTGIEGPDAIALRFGVPEPDAMFVNLRMSTMDGDDAIRRIREREATEGRRRMVIGLHSGSPSDAETAAWSGADAWLGLPSTREELIAFVDWLLGPAAMESLRVAGRDWAARIGSR